MSEAWNIIWDRHFCEKKPIRMLCFDKSVSFLVIFGPIIVDKGTKKQADDSIY